MSSPRSWAIAASSRASDAACRDVQASATSQRMPWKSVTTPSPTSRVPGVAQPEFEGAAAETDQLGGVAEPADVEGGQERLQPTADRTKPGGVRDPDVVELDVGGADQPQPDRPGHVGADAGQRHVDEEAGQALGSHGVEQGDVAVGAEVDVGLAAGEQPISTVAHRRGLHRLERRAGVLLADRFGEDDLAGRDAAQPAFLLLVGAPVEQPPLPLRRDLS